MSPAAQSLRDEGSRVQVVVAGAIAGLVSRFCIAPLDVIKIRLQLHYHSLADPLVRQQLRLATSSLTTVNVWRVARDIWKHEGLPGFWKGNIPAEALYLTYGAVQFLAYRSASQALSALDPDPLNPTAFALHIPGPAKSFISGAVAGTAATTATYPLDLLRTRFAAQGTEKVYTSLLASIRDIRLHEGPRGFFRGLNAGIGQIIPYMGLFFATYESLQPVCNRSVADYPLLALAGSGDAVAGIAASVLSKTAVFPLDTVRKRLQVQGPTRHRYHNGARIPVYPRGVVRTLAAILKKEGLRGMYRGLPVALVKAAPASAVTMWTYERALHVLQSWEEKGKV